MGDDVDAKAERRPDRVLSVSRVWPWGLAVITDPGSSEPVPSALDGNGVAAGHAVVAASIQHEVDGEVPCWRPRSHCSQSAAPGAAPRQATPIA